MELYESLVLFITADLKMLEMGTWNQQLLLVLKNG